METIKVASLLSQTHSYVLGLSLYTAFKAFCLSFISFKGHSIVLLPIIPIVLLFGPTATTIHTKPRSLPVTAHCGLLNKQQ